MVINKISSKEKFPGTSLRLFPRADKHNEHLLILELYRYGCLDSPRNFYCTDNCRKKDFTKRPILTSVSGSCAREKSGGCTW